MTYLDHNATTPILPAVLDAMMPYLFTSCATESNNAAIHAAIKANPARRHIVTSAVAHSSVLQYCKALAADGCRLTCLPVDRDGLLNPADLENTLTDDTAVVSLTRGFAQGKG